jgi:hypothetical protein
MRIIMRRKMPLLILTGLIITFFCSTLAASTPIDTFDLRLLSVKDTGTPDTIQVQYELSLPVKGPLPGAVQDPFAHILWAFGDGYYMIDTVVFSEERLNAGIDCVRDTVIHNFAYRPNYNTKTNITYVYSDDDPPPKGVAVQDTLNSLPSPPRIFNDTIDLLTFSLNLNPVPEDTIFGTLTYKAPEPDLPIDDGVLVLFFEESRLNGEFTIPEDSIHYYGQSSMALDDQVGQRISRRGNMFTKYQKALFFLDTEDLGSTELRNYFMPIQCSEEFLSDTTQTIEFTAVYFRAPFNVEAKVDKTGTPQIITDFKEYMVKLTNDLETKLGNGTPVNEELVAVLSGITYQPRFVPIFDDNQNISGYQAVRDQDPNGNIPTMDQAYLGDLTTPSVIRSSHDPNSISVEEDCLSSMEDRFDYTVHFQNIGEGAARKVTIDLYVPEQIDRAEFEPLTYYPGGRLQEIGTTDDGYYRFILDSIYLPGTMEEFTNNANTGWLSLKTRTKTFDLPKDDFMLYARLQFDAQASFNTDTVVVEFDPVACAPGDDPPPFFGPLNLTGVKVGLNFPLPSQQLSYGNFIGNIHAGAVFERQPTSVQNWYLRGEVHLLYGLSLKDEIANDTISDLFFAQLNLQARYNFNHWLGAGLGIGAGIQYAGPQNASGENAFFYGPMADLEFGSIYQGFSGGLRINAFYSSELLDRQDYWVMVPELYALYRF